ncbi:potassium/sodium hyperpolarization-activated cyclic nucleotide-gated channel 1-like [Agrilus planipennis]|uniref:Potassium/sodium hyperpolarization-activated cyclic nucleotide-gated channel 1-like n=1 Tax=Agrilus planipennis TaxID=224129 RepID=A0A1W4XAE8_AGRPL|nr:potassium/sodium hyperpolarization-activated cyclic nucleotide-gated channel 1-like [Agrilus planipennis]
MVKMAKNYNTTHNCSLPKDSQSCLPKLPPQSGKIRRLLRSFHKLILVSNRYHRTKFMFRSHASIMAERKRQIRSKYWYIVHPYSTLNVIYKSVMAVVWLMCFFIVPFYSAFFLKLVANEKILLAMFATFDIMIAVNLLMNFLTGYMDPKSKVIVLEPRKIALKYIKSYFLFDLVVFFHPNYIVYKIMKKDSRTFGIVILLGLLNFGFCIRLKTTLEMNFRIITHYLGLGTNAHKIFSLTLTSFYLTHWFTCLTYMIPTVVYYFSKLHTDAWLMQAGIQPDSGTSVGWSYLESLLCAICHFLSVGYGNYITSDRIEQILFSIITISGAIYFAYVIIFVLILNRSSNISERKYEEHLHELHQYMKYKMFPVSLRYRVLVYFEQKYQKHFFDETEILSTISEHLKHEVFLYSCRILTDKVALLKHISKMSLGYIVAKLKPEVFLPNEIIIMADAPSDYIFFIAFGSVAVYTVQGEEIYHLQDGDHFGEISLVFNDVDVSTTVVAIELSEIYKLEHKYLKVLLQRDAELNERLRITAKERYIYMFYKMEEAKGNYIPKRGVLHDLRNGKILEHNYGKRR